MTAINWKNGVSGDWSLDTNWNPAAVPGSGDAVTIAAASAVSYTVTISLPEAASPLTLNQKNATITGQATLTMSGALTLTAGAFDLQAAGTIKGGTLVMNGGTLLTNGGTLDGVKVQGVLKPDAIVRRRRHDTGRADADRQGGHRGRTGQPDRAGSPETITGFGLSNGDMLDLHKVLAGSAWNGDPSTITNFVGVSADGSNTTISVDPSGHGGTSVVATLAGINTSLDALTR